MSDYDPNVDLEPTEGFSDTGNETADDVSNRDGGGYDDKDAATESGASGKETAAAWHTARDDSGVREGKDW